MPLMWGASWPAAVTDNKEGGFPRRQVESVTDNKEGVFPRRQVEMPEMLKGSRTAKLRGLNRHNIKMDNKSLPFGFRFPVCLCCCGDELLLLTC